MNFEDIRSALSDADLTPSTAVRQFSLKQTLRPARSAPPLKFHKLLIFAPDSVQSAKNAILAWSYSGTSGVFHTVFHRIVEKQEGKVETNVRIPFLTENNKSQIASSGLFMFAVKMKAAQR